MLFNSVRNGSSNTSFSFTTLCKNTSHFLERKDSPSSQLQMSRSQTFGEVPNSPTDTFSSTSHQAVKIVVSYTCGIRGKLKLGFFFKATWSQSVKYKLASHKHPEAGCVALVETSGAPAAMYFADKSTFTKIGWNKRQRHILTLHLCFQESKKYAWKLYLRSFKNIIKK